MGVYFDKGRSQYRARFNYLGERIEVGRFDTELKAKRAISKKKKELKEKYSFFHRDETASLDNWKMDFEPTKKAKFLSTPEGPNYFAKLRSWLKRPKGN